MIILRQKTYSGKGTQILFRLKKAANRAETVFNNAGLKIGDKISQTITGKPVTNPSFRFRPKSGMQLKRETISTINSADQAKNTIALDPGGTLGKVVNETVVQPAKHAPIGTIASQFSPVPGTGIWYTTKIAPKEAKLYDKLGIGKVFKPIRNSIDKHVTNNTMIGAGRGFVGGLKTAMA